MEAVRVSKSRKARCRVSRSRVVPGVWELHCGSIAGVMHSGEEHLGDLLSQLDGPTWRSGSELSLPLFRIIIVMYLVAGLPGKLRRQEMFAKESTESPEKLPPRRVQA
ncbi:hypothetical protein MRX96_015216 [Rhipicephalus microplus]